MRFPLRIRREASRQDETDIQQLRVMNPSMNIGVNIGSKRRHGRIEGAYIDTGCPKTVLYPMDIQKLDINIKRIRRLAEGDEIEYGVPFFKEEIGLYPIENVAVTLMNDAGEGQRFKPEKIYVVGISYSEINESDLSIDKKDLLQVPSLIGLDFIESIELSLYVNPSESEAYLEKTSSS